MVELYLYDGSDNWLRREGHKEVYDRPGVLNAPVYSITDVKQEIEIAGQSVGRIDRLGFLTHGAPGLIWLPKGGIDAQNVRTLSQISALHLSKGAQIWIFACQTAQGRVGEYFLKQLGTEMLGWHGGLALAADSFTWSWIWYGHWLPPWGSVIAAKVAPGGAVTIVRP